MSRLSAAERIDWQAFLAETIAVQDFYRALGEQVERAKRREVMLPVVPPVEELTFVDGFLLWKGRPVWYSGEGRTAPAAGRMDGPGFLETSVLSRPLPGPDPPRPRRSLRRWLRLRWRALAYGEAT
jgi:hypothetical protein